MHEDSDAGSLCQKGGPFFGRRARESDPSESRLPFKPWSVRIVGDQTHYHRNVSPLAKRRNTKANFTKNKLEVGSTNLLQLSLVSLGSDALHRGQGVVGRHHMAFELAHSTMHSHHRRLTYNEMEMDVRTAPFNAVLKQLLD
jgi:hypothetical protein